MDLIEKKHSKSITQVWEKSEVGVMQTSGRGGGPSDPPFQTSLLGKQGQPNFYRSLLVVTTKLIIK